MDLKSIDLKNISLESIKSKLLAIDKKIIIFHDRDLKRLAKINKKIKGL